MLSFFRSKSWRDRNLWIVFPLMFLVVFAANGVLVYFAVASWPGLAYENASERGRKFNQVLAAESLENKLGWRFAVLRDGDAVVLDARDSKGNPLTDLDVSGTLVRPLGNVESRRLEFHSTGEGRYEASFETPLKGQWELRFAAERSGERVHGADRFVIR